MPPSAIQETDDCIHAVLRGRANALFDDSGAIAALRSRLLRLAMRNLNAADAEDATQETLLALHCALDRYRGSAPFETYAIATLRNKTIDIYRRHGKARAVAPETLEAMRDQASADGTHSVTEADRAPDPSELLEAERKVQIFWVTLKACLNRLPERMRAVFELREILELDWPVVCKHVHVTSIHGGVLAHRARTQIRSRWEAEETRARRQHVA